MATEWTLVTGASSGIGEAFAKLAASRGRNLVISARNEAKLDQMAVELKEAHGVEIVVVGADLAAPGEAARLWSAATADGRMIDTLVNNAGLGRHGQFADDEGFGGWAREAASIQVNVVAMTELMKLAIGHMKDVERGRILNVASIAGFVAGPGMAVYHATKAYVISLSKAVQAEIEGRDITVTAVCPGVTKSNFHADAEMLSARVTRMSGPLPSSADVAEAGWNAAIRGETVHIPGFLNRLTVLLAKFAPAALSTMISKYALGKD
ncbi:MAG: SDR family NAD(P)-dependent oxidoreductase [Pseudomonadota bacterium]